MILFILWTLCEIYLKSLFYKFTKCEEEMWKQGYESEEMWKQGYEIILWKHQLLF